MCGNVKDETMYGICSERIHRIIPFQLLHKSPGVRKNIASCSGGAVFLNHILSSLPVMLNELLLIAYFGCFPVPFSPASFGFMLADNWTGHLMLLP